MRTKFTCLVPLLASLILVSAVGGACAAEKAAKKQGTRYGLGMNLNRADVRFEMDKNYALDAFLGFDFLGGNDKYFSDMTQFTIGGYYLQWLTKRNPVGLHLLGGFSYTSGDMGVASESDFALFGGLGCEYYLPGTERLSLEGQIGVGLHFLSGKVDGGGSGSGMELTLGDLTGGTLMLRYYFD